MPNSTAFHQWSDNPDNNTAFDGVSVAEGSTAVSDVNNLIRIVTSQIRAAFPTGIITLWSGSVANIPDGWYLCDGTNGTPDLTDKFVVGAGDAYAPDDIGGEASVTLTASQIASHTHIINPPNTTSTAGGNHNHGGSTGAGGNHSHGGSTSNAGSHNHGGSTGASGGHNHTYNYSRSRKVNDTGANNVVEDMSAPGSGPQRSTSSVGNHAHSIPNEGSHTHSISASGTHAHSITNSGTHTHNVDIAPFTSGSAGSGDSHENRPPYYALAYIMMR